MHMYFKSNLVSPRSQYFLLSYLHIIPMIEMPNISSRDLGYPVLDLYSCPRVSGQRVNNSVIPLLKYRQPITANRCSQNYQDDYVNPVLCRKLKEKDGIIFSLKDMIKKNPELKAMKALICVCMYNETKHAINLTLNGIYKNLKHFRAQGISEGELAVVLIQDGILKLVQNRKQRTFAGGQNSMIQFYKALDRNEGKAKCALEERIHVILDEIQNFERKGMSGNVSRNKDFPPSIQKNIALVYQNLWKPSMTHFDGEQRQNDDGNIKLRVFSCFKHTNGTKLSSHLWFFEGFCRYYHPQFCVLLDVGTTPDELGLVNLLKGFSAGKDVGGVTGFMSVDANFKSLEGDDDGKKKKNCLVDCLFSIEKAQQYEYIIAHFIDKNAESTLGFLHVLPGAWSAYRYEALIKSQRFEPNLLERSYFKMIINPDAQQLGYQQANMYLAEDRILSLGIYCQMDSQYTLKYVPDAIAYTDPMKDHQNLMKQRRRWINSSLFAFLYVFDNYYFSVQQSKHNCFRKYISITLSMFLAALSFIFSYISPSIYLFVLFTTIAQTGWVVEYDNQEKVDASRIIAQVVSFVYVMIFFSAIAGSLTGNQWTKSAHFISGVFTVFNFILLLLVGYNLVVTYLKIVGDPISGSEATINEDFMSQPKQAILVIVLAITFGSQILIYFVHIFSHCKFVCKLFIDSISYFCYTGAYTHTMVIHGFCNVDDVSWGTKGSTASHGGKKYEINKVFFVSSWIFTNALIAFICIYVDVIANQNNSDRGGWVLIAISILGASTILIKTIFAVIYQIKWLFCERCCLQLLRRDGPRRLGIVDDFWRQQMMNWDNIRNSNLNPSMRPIHRN